jgi:hypothetical protein
MATTDPSNYGHLFLYFKSLFVSACLYIYHLSIYLSIHPSIHLSIYHLSTYLSIYLPSYVSVSVSLSPYKIPVRFTGLFYHGLLYSFFIFIKVFILILREVYKTVSCGFIKKSHFNCYALVISYFV